MSKKTIELDDYERANLLWLLRAIGYPHDPDQPAVKPFDSANTGDWVGQVASKLGAFDDPPKYRANATLEVLKRSVEFFLKDNDSLIQMWDQQERFMKLLQKERGFPEFPTDITSKKGQKFLKDITHHVMDELFEAGQHLKNSKSHRATLIPEIDRAAYVEELVDALHLFFELCIAAGVSVDELKEAYLKKGEVNFNRIRNGY